MTTDCTLPARPKSKVVLGMFLFASMLGACGTASPAASTPATAKPSTTPTQSASPTPASTPEDSPEPTATGLAGTTFHVDLVLSTGRTVTIDVKDDSGRLLEAVSGTPGDGASVESGVLAVVNEAPTTLRLTWSGPPCATDNFLLIEPSGARLTVVQPECSGDAIPFDRVLLLTFSGEISADDVDAVMQLGGDTPA